MTLDDFLRTLELLIEDRESRDDAPGEGNFGCEDCRNCNHCRFCIGCDSCQDCTYCEESIDCTSCTQSKRCVSCEKVSYCEDCRDCQLSRYLTLCVGCTDCVHCLGCVGLEGAEFYVLNEKRSRKEYFAVLRQVQELMQARMVAGWRPPGIGLASELIDAIAASHDAEIVGAPWLAELCPPAAPPPPSPAPVLLAEHRALHEPVREPDYRSEPSYERPPTYAGRERPGQPESVEARRRELEDDREFARALREPERAWAPERGRQDAYRDPEYPDPEYPDPPRRGREPRWPEPEPEPEPAEDAGYRERERERLDHDDRLRRRARELDVPQAHDQQPTQPFVGRRDTRAAEADSRAHTQARAAPHEDAPAIREREPSSPWADEAEAAAGRLAKRGSLRRAGRPARKPEDEPAPDPTTGTSSGSHRTGSTPARSEGTHTGTGLRLGRKPTRKPGGR